MMSKLKKALPVLLIAAMIVPVISFVGTRAEAAYGNTYENTGSQRDDIIGVAKTQLGYREGKNNDTKYGTWLGYPNQPWCASFVSWCARQAGIPTSILKNSACAGADAGFFNIPYYDGSSYVPKPGDLFFTKGWTHVGLVYYVDGDSFYTIEGNSNDNGGSEGNGVYSLERKLSDYYFGVPDYDTRGSMKVPDYDERYPSPVKAYTLETGKTIVYDSIDGNALLNKIYDTDLCTISEIYDNEWCLVTFPLDRGGTDSGYVKTSVFIDTSYRGSDVKIDKQITTYTRSDLKNVAGYAGKDDDVYVIGKTENAIHICYPLLDGNTYKAAWIPASELKIDENDDGEEKMALDVSAGNVVAKAGEEVSVSIKIANNPGITSMRLVVDYDKEALEMTGFSFGDALSSMSRATSQSYGSPYSMSMYSAVDDLKDNGTIATIKFRVNENAGEDTYKINISYDKDDIFNMDGDPIPVNIEAGSIRVCSYIEGDLNSDGSVNMRDIVLLQQVINGWDVEYSRPAADYNKDGSVNMRDIVALQQYVNGQGA